MYEPRAYLVQPVQRVANALIQSAALYRYASMTCSNLADKPVPQRQLLSSSIPRAVRQTKQRAIYFGCDGTSLAFLARYSN